MESLNLAGEHQIGRYFGALEMSLRVEILDFIKAHPGVHFREINRSLNLATGTLQYHLYELERERKITSRRIGVFKRFYPSLQFDEEQMNILAVLSQQVERDAILFVLQNPGCTQTDLAKHLGLSPATVLWHTKKLERSGLLKTTTDGVFVRYSIMTNHSHLLDLIKNYHTSIWEEWSSRLADLITEASGIEVKNDRE